MPENEMSREEALRKVQAQYGGLVTPSAHGVRTGAKFQAELDDTHRVMVLRKWGAVYCHERRTVGAPPDAKKGRAGTLRFQQGGNPVDYSGHINIRKMSRGTVVPIVWPPIPVGTWESCGPRDPGCYRLPVVFDAKREGTGDSFHCHSSKVATAQLLQLREAVENGAAGFLLVHLVKHASVFIVARPAMMDTLLRGGTVQLVEKGSGQHLVPSVQYEPGRGWPYAAAVPVALGW